MARRRKPPVLAADAISPVQVAPARNGTSFRSISLPGVYHAGGRLFDPNEREHAWQGNENRDRTILAMSRNTILGSCLLYVEMSIRRVLWRVEPADDSPQARDVAKFVQECLDQMRGLWPGETMARIQTFIPWGWSALEPIYMPRDDGRVGWLQWRLVPQITRYAWEFDTADNPTALVQYNWSNPSRPSLISIPLDRLIIFRFSSYDNSPEGFTPLRVAYDSWFYRQSFQQLEGILFERFGGFPVGRMPADDIKAQNEAYQQMQLAVTGVRINQEAGLILASDRDSEGYYLQDFELKTPAAGASVPTADPILRRYADEMVTVFLANLTRTGQNDVGSFALADVQSSMFLQGIAAHLDTIQDGINSQEMPRFMRLNQIDPALMPRIVHGDIEGADLARLGAYLVALSQAGVLSDTPELRQFVHEAAGLPTPTAEEIRTEHAAMAKDAQQQPPDQPNGTPADQAAQDGPPPAPVTATDVATFATLDSSPIRVTVSKEDLDEAERWFDEQMPEYARMLSAKPARSS